MRFPLGRRTTAPASEPLSSAGELLSVSFWRQIYLKEVSTTEMRWYRCFQNDTNLGRILMGRFWSDCVRHVCVSCVCMGCVNHMCIMCYHMTRVKHWLYVCLHDLVKNKQETWVDRCSGHPGLFQAHAHYVQEGTGSVRFGRFGRFGSVSYSFLPLFVQSKQ